MGDEKKIPVSIRMRSLELVDRYPNSTLYYYRLGGLDTIFKLPSRRDLMFFFASVSPSWLHLPLMYDEEAVEAQSRFLEATVLYPTIETIDSCLIAESMILTKSIVETSGFLDESQVLQDLKDYRRAINQSYENAFIVSICAAFPSISPEEIDTWDLPRMLRHVVLAEAILGRPVFGGPPEAPAITEMGPTRKSATPRSFGSAFDAQSEYRAPKNIDMSIDNKKLSEMGFG